MQEYVLVDQEKIKVDIYRKYNQGNWGLETLGEEDVLKLESVGLEMRMAEIYKDIEF